jgi:carotenoid cleavage dioxygenase-like enzyme
MTTQSLQPIDLASEPHLQGVFASQDREVDVADLLVEGELPLELDGEYLRNGPNPRFTPLGSYLYPLDGDGMMHRVSLQDGKASYTNRFVRTPTLVAEEKAGRALWGGLSNIMYIPGADLVGPVLSQMFKDLPGINVVRHGGRLLALGESTTPFRLSPELQTLGRETFGDLIPVGITAHPKIDPVSGEMVACCYALDEPFLTWSVIAKDGSVVRAATPVEGLDRSTMIHDMALTPNYLVLILGPFFFDFAAAMAGGSPVSWEPDQGARIALIPRDGGPTHWISTEPFWAWHTANAYEAAASNGDVTVVLDFVRWDAPGGFVPGPNRGRLARWTLNPLTGEAKSQTLVDRSMEFPRVDERSITQPHRIVGTSLKTGGRDLLPGDADTLGWYDTASGSFDVWAAGDLAVGEQVFIPKPGDPDPTHGWWTTIATDRNDLRSRLVILSAQDPTAGPVATVQLPQRVPQGLHGVWLPTRS